MATASTAGKTNRALIAVLERHSLVTDTAGALTPAQKAALQEKLDDFHTRLGPQLAVLIVPTTGPEGIEAYAMRVFSQWELGSAKDNDGLLILVAVRDRRMRIEVGQGLEGRVPDLAALRIIDMQMTPRFRQADYHGGIDAAVDALIERLGSGTGVDASVTGDEPDVGIMEADATPRGSTITPAGQIFLAALAALLSYGSYRWRAVRLVTAGLMAVGVCVWAVSRLVGGDMVQTSLLVVGGCFAAVLGTLIFGTIGVGMRASYRKSQTGFMVQWLIVLGITGGVALAATHWIPVAITATLSMLFVFAASLGGRSSSGVDDDDDDGSSRSASSGSFSSSSSSSSDSSSSGGSSSGGGASGSW